MTDDERDRGGETSEPAGTDGPFETEVGVRYSDVDTYGHVNNAVFATFLEEARIDYLEAVLGSEARTLVDDESGVGMVVASLELSFRQPLGLTESVTVVVGVPELGTSSFPIEYEVRSDDGVVATGETTMVAYDREAHESVPLPDHWRERIRSFEGL